MCFFNSAPKVQTPDPAPPPPAPEPVPDSVAPVHERSMMRGYSLAGRKTTATYRSDLNIPGGSLGGNGLNVSR
jgi:hypothetical protein